jgi:hypothetical protein
MSMSVSYVPEPDAMPKAYMGGTDRSIPVVVLGDITILIQPTRGPDYAIAYLTTLIDEVTALRAKVQEAQS